MGLFFFDFLRKCLSRCPNFKKPCQPQKFSGCAPAYIWYKQSGFCSLNFIGSIYRNLGGLVVWYLKRWPGFDSQPGTMLPTVNYLQLMIYFKKFLIKHWYLPYIFLQNIRSEYFFSYAAASEYSLSKQILWLPPNFLYYFLLIWPFQEQFHIRLYLQKCKLVIVSSQIKIFPEMFLRQLNFGVLLAKQLFHVYYTKEKLVFFNL